MLKVCSFFRFKDWHLKRNVLPLLPFSWMTSGSELFTASSARFRLIVRSVHSLCSRNTDQPLRTSAARDTEQVIFTCTQTHFSCLFSQAVSRHQCWWPTMESKRQMCKHAWKTHTHTHHFPTLTYTQPHNTMNDQSKTQNLSCSSLSNLGEKYLEYFICTESTSKPQRVID